MSAERQTQPVEAAQLRILVVDDDPDIRDLVAQSLARHGYDVVRAANVAEADEVRRRLPLDLVILDIMMPGEDGLSFCRRLSQDSDVPIIILSALDGSSDKIVGLEVGADNYVTKPCDPRELIAHVRAVLRRSRAKVVDGPRGGRLCEFEGWQLDLVSRYLRDPRGLVVDLASSEFALMRVLTEHPRRALSRDQLLDALHGHAAGVFDRAIDVQVSRLRRKLGADGPRLIRTVRHEGYMFMASVVQR